MTFSLFLVIAFLAYYSITIIVVLCADTDVEEQPIHRSPSLASHITRRLNDTSPVVSMTVDSCEPSKRRRRRRSAVPLAASASAAVDINIDDPSSGIAVNETAPANSGGVITSLFNSELSPSSGPCP